MSYPLNCEYKNCKELPEWECPECDKCYCEKHHEQTDHDCICVIK